MLFGMSVSLFYHLGNGIRHMAWDIGWGYELPKLVATGWAVIVFSIVMAFVTFGAGYALRGGA